MGSQKSKSPTDQPLRCGGVDTHFHVFDAGQSVPGARYTPAYAAPLQAWQAGAQPLGITHGVLVQTSFLGTDNRRLLAELALHPHTLRGVAVLNPSADAAHLDALHAQGVRGIRLNLAGQGPNAIRPWLAATALWDALLRLGWHVELHTDSGALPGVLQALPQALPLVIDHFGKPVQATLTDPTVLALQHRARLATAAGTASGRPGLHVKLSAAYRLGAAVSPSAIAALWLGELGPEALLWGSDWPCTNHEPLAHYATLYQALADWLGDAPGVVRAARVRNPMRLYFEDTSAR
jgi:predicted TIM-barrel fold metal-dependent hydrolase